MLAWDRVAVGGRMTPSFLKPEYQRDGGQGNMDSCASRRREASRKCSPPPTHKKAKPPTAGLTFCPAAKQYYSALRQQHPGTMRGSLSRTCEQASSARCSRGARIRATPQPGT